MYKRRWAQLFVGGGAAVFAAAVPRAAASQDFASEFMNFGTDTVFIVVRLDTLGVLPAAGADSVTLDDSLGTAGYSLERVLPGGTWVTVASTTMDDPSSAIALGRDLREDQPDLIAEAGPLARATPGGLAFVFTDLVIVQFAPGTTPAARAAVEDDFGLVLIHVSPIDVGLTRYRFTVGSPPYFTAIGQLTSDVRVDWAYPDYMEGIEEAFTPNDAFFPDQWHLGSGGTGNIDATHAWDITKGSPSVIVAVLEVFGFDITNPDLAANLWTDPDDLTVHGWNFRLCNGTDIPCSSDVGAPLTKYHGTFVAGLAAAAGDNSIGVTGVCFRCRLMPIVMGGSHWGITQAFRWAEMKGASVINASWWHFHDPYLVATIADVAINSGGGQGVPVIFASGSGPIDVCQPEAYLGSQPEAYLVGATDNQDLRTSWSNFGDCLDMVAPGGTQTLEVSIVSTDPVGNNFLNRTAFSSGTCPAEFSSTFDYTKCAGGTSAAAPQVAGVVGLMLSLNPALTTPQIYQILNETAEKVSCADAMYGGLPACPASWMSRSQKYGFGRLDAFAAVQAAQATMNCVSCPNGGGGRGRGTGDGFTAEAGTRLGYTRLTGSTDEDVWNIPGSGPRTVPVVYIGAVSPAPSIFSWLWEIQVGHSRRSQTAPATDEVVLTLAAQLALLVPLPFSSYQFYFGGNYAYQNWDDGLGTINTPSAWGLALGLRKVFFGHFPIRLEGRWRTWDDGVDEVGLAAVFGVILS